MTLALSAGLATSQIPNLALAQSDPSPIRPTRAPDASPAVPGQPTIADAIPGLDREDVRVPAGRLVREGVILVERTGSLLRSPAGEWIVAFPRRLDEEQAQSGRPGVSPPPMPMLPSRQLELMVRAIGDYTGPVAVTVTGEVTTYRGRNYLLPTRHRLSRLDEPAAPEREDASPDRPEQPTEPLPTIEDPRVQELFEQLEAEGEPIGRSASFSESPDADIVSDATPVLREARALSRQRGVLERTPSGRLGFVTGTQRFIMLPCAELERLENLEARLAPRSPFIISGRMYHFAGSDYLLLTAWSSPPPTDLGGG